MVMMLHREQEVKLWDELPTQVPLPRAMRTWRSFTMVIMILMMRMLKIRMAHQRRRRR
jgi:hypothetical protein